MLGLHERSRHSVDPKLTSSKAHDGPLLNFGRLNEVSSTSTPIQFGAVAVPTEVFYEIIDNLSSDKSTLAHLSRVCKSWYYGTRPHLFREVSIKETGTTYLWYPFARTLRTTPEVCGLVRELHISMDMHSIRHTMSVGGSDKNEYNLYVLANVVRKLQGLKVLTFTDAEWHVDDSSELVPVPRIYHLGLRTLVFRKGHFSRSLYEIVSWFPGLKTLCVEREHGGLAQVGETQALCKGLQLETLELNSEPMTYDRLLQEIAQTESVNTVRSFTYHVWHASLLVLCEFLARAGPHLHTLRLAFKDERLLEEWKRRSFFGVPQIAECTALETLTLSFPLKSSRIWGNHVAAVSHCIERLFAAIHTEKLHTIIFHLDITHAETQFENLQFETLRRFLHRLPYLQHIVIITRRSSVNRAYKDMVRSLAPFRRMLHVRASDGPDELPSRRTSSVVPGGQGHSETAPYHAHGGPLFLPMDTHTSDSDSAESEIQSE